MELAASGHLAYDALCFFSLTFPLTGPSLPGEEGPFYFLLGSEPALSLGEN